MFDFLPFFKSRDRYTEAEHNCNQTPHACSTAVLLNVLVECRHAGLPTLSNTLRSTSPQTGCSSYNTYNHTLQ